MQADSLDAKDVAHLLPHLPPFKSDATTLAPMADREDVDGDAVVGVVHPHSLQDVHPHSCLSQQEGHHRSWDRPQQQAEDILCHHLSRRNRSRPPRIQTSQRGLQIGMHVIPVGLTWRMGIPARRAPNICESQTTAATLPDKMRSSTLTGGTGAARKTATRRYSPRCDS